MNFTEFMNIDMIYLSIVGMIIGIILGSRVHTKINMPFYILSGAVIAYFLGAFPYYNFPISCAFMLSIIGLLIGNGLNRIFSLQESLDK